MSGAGLIELLAARLGGRGAASAAVPADGVVRMPRVTIPVHDLPSISTTRGNHIADAERYAAMDTPAPPIVVVRENGDWTILDGLRRTDASRMAGRQTIEALDATALFERNSARSAPDGGPTRAQPNAGNALQRALRDRMGE